MGREFPSDLRSFFHECGFGFFSQGRKDAVSNPTLINRAIPPMGIADLMTDEGESWLSRGKRLPFHMPFFDTGESMFLCLDLDQDPCPVIWPHVASISPDLVSFYRRLTERAGFYLDLLG